MCPPLALAGPLLLGATGLSAVAGGVGALQSAAQARYQASIATRNAALEREAAQQSNEATRDDAMAQYRRIAQVKGAQRARAAANGVGLDFGTAADVVADTEFLGGEDVRRIRQQGEQRSRGFEIEAANSVAEASAKRQAATGALIGGAFDFGSTVLGGASQYASLQTKLGMKSFWQK